MQLRLLEHRRVLVCTSGVLFLPGHPELDETRNTGRTTPSRSVLPVDSFCVDDPPTTRRCGPCGSQLLRPHPDTERATLFGDAPGRSAAVNGLDWAESRQLASALVAHAIASANLYRHRGMVARCGTVA